MYPNFKSYSERHTRRKKSLEVRNQLVALNQETNINIGINVRSKCLQHPVLHPASTSNQSVGNIVTNSSANNSNFASSLVPPELLPLGYNCESSSDDDFYNAESFKEFLSSWVLRHKIPMVAVSEILKHLRLYPGFENLPNDCRTVMKTPRSTDIQIIAPGQYCSFGLKPQLLQLLQSSSLEERNVLRKGIQLQFKIDGIPLFKSSSQQFWPILGYVKAFTYPVFVIGLYSGKAKPENIRQYLEPFVMELKDLMESGLLFQDFQFKILINCFTCDAPARAYILSTKGHAGYKCCTKCEIPGEYKDHSVALCGTGYTPRTDASFRNRADEDHHTGITPLVDLNVFMKLAMSSLSVPFGVVHFLDTNEVEVMPMNFKMQQQPVKSLWSNHPIRVFYEYGQNFTIG
ncbi:unnamed protein product [Allacma fusca]|uniref:Transposase domain-containing protein n=1 Tax=Allacma fusca TaxID=39272 RepID=A0A8J2KAD1_9HEXA|nr:unnamed protein product [Allacma fusca]